MNILTVSASQKRLYWLDNAKAFGIIAVFWGHICEKIFFTQGPDVYLQYKLIYSFHIPLFFIISGYLAKHPGSNIHAYIREKFMLRIVPFIFFNILISPVYLAINLIARTEIDMKQVIVSSVLFLRGAPIFNQITWFLVCLFMVEIIHYFVSPYIEGKSARISVCIVIFYVLGWLINWKKGMVVAFLQMGDSWAIYEAFVAYGFFLFGKLLATTKSCEKESNVFLQILFIGITALILVFTFDLNQGPFLGDRHNVVLLGGGVYGNIVFFPITAIAGSACILMLSRVIGQNRLFTYLGKNSLILMGLNGFFLHFINIFLVNQTMKFISGSVVSLVVLCGVLTGISLVLCTPFVLLLARYVPQLTGNPKRIGPVFPSFIKTS